MRIEIKLSDNIILKNPLILGSGIIACSADGIIDACRMNPGGIVTKSIGYKSNAGYKQPNIVVYENMIINSMGLPNPGFRYFSEELKTIFDSIEIPLIISIYSTVLQEFEEMANAFYSISHGLELNFSCPHASKNHGGINLASDSELCCEIIKRVKKIYPKPVFAKIPFTALELAKTLEKAGVDGIVAINTLPAMDIDIYEKSPILGNIYGGLSGPAIFPVALNSVYRLYSEINIPIIGCGGIYNGEDVIKMIMAGATAVQIGSSIYFRGREAFNLIIKEITDIMDKLGVKDINSLRGCSHEN